MTTPNKPLVALAAICIAISWILVILFLLAFIAVTICVAAGLLPTRINIGHSGQNFLAAFFATFFICGAIWISLAFSLSCPHCGFKFLKNPKGLGPTKFQYHPNSAGKHGINGWAVWCGFALAAYVIGLSYIARKESTGVELQYWPSLFLAAPILLALFMNANPFLKNALLISAVLGLWIIRCLRYAFSGTERNLGRTVSGLLAGIVWVDLLAVVDVERPLAIIFPALFLLALFFQRFIPAT